MDPSEVEIPRSIMDPAPPPDRRSGSGKKKLIVAAVVILGVLLCAGVAVLIIRTMDTSSPSAESNGASGISQPTPTPETENEITDAVTKQVQVDGRTFTHIVPGDWKTAGSDGDIQKDSRIPGTGDGATRDVVLAIRYNQGTYALNPAAPAGTYCDRIIGDSESVKVSPTDERFVNYCGKAEGGNSDSLAYVLFTKYSYKKGKILNAQEQSDLIGNVLLYGRIVPKDEKPFYYTYETTSQLPDFIDMITIFQSIEYVEVQ